MDRSNLSPVDRATLSLSYGDYQRFSQLMQDRFGLSFPEKRRMELEIGVRRAFAASTCRDLDSYYRMLLDPVHSGMEMERLVNYLTIGETHFFRDAGQFDALYNTVLPELIERRRGSRTLRIWSAGCASGEEPYSIAILLRLLLPDLENWNITILGTDLNTQHLERARRALYSDWAFREGRAKMLRGQFFTERGNHYELKPEVRRMAQFGLLNLSDDSFPSYETNTMFMDLILCRNVTIYFPEAVTRQVVGRFYNALTDGGWLVIGHSEHSLDIYRRFRPRNFPDAILYQRPSAVEETAGPVAAVEATTPASLVPIASPTAPVAPETFPVVPETSPVVPTPFPVVPTTFPVVPLAAPVEAVLQGTAPLNPFRVGVPLQKNETGAAPTSDAIQRAGADSRADGTARAGVEARPSPTLPPAAEAVSFEEAQALMSVGRVDQARDVLLRWLADHPAHAAGCALLGTAYANLGNGPEAERWCKMAIAHDRLCLEAYYTLALVFQHQGQREQAIEMMKKVVYINRSDILGHFSLADLFHGSGQTAMALKFLENTRRLLEGRPIEELVPRSGDITVGRLAQTVIELQQTWGANG